MVNVERCIGCGVCVQVDPDVFSLDHGRNVAKVIHLKGNEQVHQAAQSCPVDAIFLLVETT